MLFKNVPMFFFSESFNENDFCNLIVKVSQIRLGKTQIRDMRSNCIESYSIKTCANNYLQAYNKNNVRVS